MKKLLFVALMLAACSRLPAPSKISSDEVCLPSAGRDDPLSRLLAGGVCPRDVRALRVAIAGQSQTIQTAFVNNRSFHNPEPGSFSFFEWLSGGDLFFGHFTTREGDTLVLDQTPSPGALMIELIAWDQSKRVFNFYELTGDGSQGNWHYRGDSADIYADNALLHRQPDPARPRFGTRLRCSGCHVSGGPIMKELAAPHNDWWRTNRPLPLGSMQLEGALAVILEGVKDASALAAAVTQSHERLAPRNALSLREQLRPLFCPEEINFVADAAPHALDALNVAIPSSFFVDSRLANGDVAMPRSGYAAALAAAGSRFPETDRADGDHAWLAPVKAAADVAAIRLLVEQGTIDEEFVADVIAIDLTNPAFSSTRCGLLKAVPEQRSATWRSELVNKLSIMGTPAARELVENLTDADKTRVFHAARAARVVAACNAKGSNPGQTDALYHLLLQRRIELATSEISKNPKGQILEPGFRLIFPRTTVTPVAGRLMLTDDCSVR